jgi:uncharacterized protein (DUF1800 family)
MLQALPANQWSPGAAAHILNRAAFGGTPKEVADLHAMGMWPAVEWLLTRGEESDLFPAPALEPSLGPAQQMQKDKNLAQAEKDMRRREMQTAAREATRDLRDWWITRMAATPNPVREKAVLFWHGHWATSIQKVKDPFFMLQQNETLRARALGPFGIFARDMTRDPAMIRYLDLNSSKAGHPNENFARELMELFTLGEGHYTENDIREAARAFTGYRIAPGTGGFRFAPRDHDGGSKSLFGKSGRFSGDEVVDLIVTQPRCAVFIASKLWEFYAGEKPAEPLARKLGGEYRRLGMDTGKFLAVMWTSEEFHSAKVVRRQIKSPVQWLMQTCRFLEVAPPEGPAAANILSQLGQNLFAPPNVKGWDQGRAWISSSTLLLRYNLAGQLVRGDGPAQTPDLSRLLPDGTGEDAACDLLGERFFQSPLPPSLRGKTLAFLRENTSSARSRRDLIHLLMSTPDYQLT